MARLFFILLFNLCIFSAQAQSSLFTTKDSLNMFCDKVMQGLMDAKFSQAIQLFRQKSVLDTTTINNIDKTLVDQMTSLQPYYKKVVGYEFVEEKAIRNSVTRRRYLLKFEHYFITVDFILYNNGSGWTISNFNYYDNPKELF